MLVEALVLRGDGAVKHVLRYLVDGHALAVLHVEGRDLGAVGIEHRGGLAYHVLVRIRVVWQVGQPAVDVSQHADAKGDAGDEQESNQRDDDEGNGVCL